MITILILVVLLSSIHIIYLYWSRNQIKRISNNRLRYIKDCFDTLYQYEHNPTTFLAKCKDLVHVKRLAEYHIIDSPHLSNHIKRNWHKLTPAEKQFVCFMEAGFSNRELCAIFHVGKIGSVYVKYYRIRSKITKK